MKIQNDWSPEDKIRIFDKIFDLCQEIDADGIQETQEYMEEEVQNIVFESVMEYVLDYPSETYVWDKFSASFEIGSE